MDFEYLDPDSVADMPIDELVRRTSWLVTSMANRYAKMGFQHILPDLISAGTAEIIRRRDQYIPGRSFEGWVRVYVKYVMLNQLRMARYPVSISVRSMDRMKDKGSIGGIRVAPDGPDVGVDDDAIERRDRERVMEETYTDFLKLCDELPDVERALVLDWIGSTPRRRRMNPIFRDIDSILDPIRSRLQPHWDEIKA